MSALWLVQRCKRDTSPLPGLDGVFRLDYMGSAEFEFGAVPQSLKRIRAAKGRKVQEAQINGRTVYVYGGKAERAAFFEALPGWAARGCPGKEMSYFHQHLTGSTERWVPDVDMWWALREDVMFTLDADIAKSIEQAVTR